MYNKKIIWIVLAGLALRILVFLMLQPWTMEGEEKILRSDANGFHITAIEIKENLAFGKKDPYVSALRTPGYPAFIALFYQIFGNNPWVVLLIQILMDSALIILIYLFTLKLFNQSLALIASLFYSLDPIVIQYVNFLLSDILFVFLIFTSYMLLWRFVEQLKIKWLLAHVVLLAFAVYVRPIGMYLIILNGGWLVLYFLKQKLPANKTILIYSMAFIILISPWLLRNYFKHGHIFFSTSGNYNSLVLYAAEVSDEAKVATANDVIKMHRNEIEKKYPEISHDNIFQIHKEYKKIALDIITAHPIAFVTSYIRGQVDMFFSTNRLTYEMIIGNEKKIPYDAFKLIRDRGPAAIIQIINDYPKSTLFYVIIILSWFIGTYFYAVKGFIFLFSRNEWLKVSFLLIPILYFTILTGQAGLARFKLPIIPFYCLFISVGIFWKSNMKRNEKLT